MRRPRYRVRSPSLSPFAIALLLAILPIAALMQGVWISRNRPKFGQVKPMFLRLHVERTDCPICGGLGTIRDPESPDMEQVCPVCFGVGGHEYRRLNRENEVLCPACAGMGRVYDEELQDGRLCMRCGGRGLINLGLTNRKPRTANPVTGNR